MVLKGCTEEPFKHACRRIPTLTYNFIGHGNGTPPPTQLP